MQFTLTLWLIACFMKYLLTDCWYYSFVLYVTSLSYWEVMQCLEIVESIVHAFNIWHRKLYKWRPIRYEKEISSTNLLLLYYHSSLEVNYLQCICKLLSFCMIYLGEESVDKALGRNWLTGCIIIEMVLTWLFYSAEASTAL